jgi:hypothetical protein
MKVIFLRADLKYLLPDLDLNSPRHEFDVIARQVLQFHFESTWDLIHQVSLGFHLQLIDFVALANCELLGTWIHVTYNLSKSQGFLSAKRDLLTLCYRCEVIAKFFQPGALFSYRQYRNLWISSLITVIAITGFPVVLAVAVLDAGASVSKLGFILAARIAAGVILAPFAGVWVDRAPRKIVLFLADGFRAVLGIAVVFLPYTADKFWLLMTIVFIMGVSDARILTADELISRDCTSLAVAI